MMTNGIRVPSKEEKKPGVAFSPFQLSSVLSATRWSRRVISSSLWLPTQVAL